MLHELVTTDQIDSQDPNFTLIGPIQEFAPQETQKSDYINFLSQMSDNPDEFLEGSDQMQKILNNFNFTGRHFSPEAFRVFSSRMLESSNFTPRYSHQDAMDVLFGLKTDEHTGRLVPRSPQDILTTTLKGVKLKPKVLRRTLKLMDPENQLGGRTVLALREIQLKIEKEEAKKTKKNHSKLTELRPNRTLLVKSA